MENSEPKVEVKYYERNERKEISCDTGRQIVPQKLKKMAVCGDEKRKNAPCDWLDIIISKSSSDEDSDSSDDENK